MSAAANKAVFLSYASQDADAARRICEALRAAGVEVWFDQNELVGGDAWDAKIRKQIRECALFVPIISAATQARLEGYFRLEWKLAAQRTHTMAAAKRFLLPVVIDDTRDADAHVPEEFTAFQWTRLPGGEPTPAFVSRVHALLQTAPARSSGPATFSSPASPSKTALRRSASIIVVAITLAALVAIGSWQFWRSTRASGQRDSAAASSAPPASAGSRVGEPADRRSVVVLPFANLSDEKGGEYLSDGITEEVLNRLGKLPGLKVIARTSAFHFKGRNLPIAEIARQLGVTHVVEGSVRTAGTQVRVSARLVNAVDGAQVWADDFRDELRDAFALQDRIAVVIAHNFQLKLTPGAVTTEVRPEAYQRLLQARFHSRREDNEGWRRSIEECRAALELQPDYALAAAEMARSYIQLTRFGGIRAAEGYQQAREPAQRALQLAPALPEAHNAMGWLLRTADWDWRGAEASFRRAYELAPRNATMLLDYAIVRNNVGAVHDAVELARRALELDPLNANTRGHQALLLMFADQPAAAAQELGRALELAPNAVEWHSFLARMLVLQGRLEEARAAAEREPSAEYRLFSRALVLRASGDLTGAKRVEQELADQFGHTMATYIAELHAYAGEPDRAFEWLERGIRERDTALAWVRSSVFFRPLHPDPRWPVFLRRIGHTLPEGRGP